MSVLLKINVEISSDIKTLKFYENTKPYSITNTTGWGTPNEDTTDATSAELTITTPDSNSYTFDANSVTPFYSSWPTSDDDVSYDFDSSLLGYGTNQKFPDGIYKFYYEVVTGTATYTQTEKFFNYKNIECCVKNMIADIDYDCECSKEKIEKAKKAFIMYQGLVYAAECGQVTSFDNLLESLDKLCSGNCTNC